MQLNSHQPAMRTPPQHADDSDLFSNILLHACIVISTVCTVGVLMHIVTCCCACSCKESFSDNCRRSLSVCSLFSCAFCNLVLRSDKSAWLDFSCCTWAAGSSFLADCALYKVSMHCQEGNKHAHVSNTPLQVKHPQQHYASYTGTDLTRVQLLPDLAG